MQAKKKAALTFDLERANAGDDVEFSLDGEWHQMMSTKKRFSDISQIDILVEKTGCFPQRVLIAELRMKLPPKATHTIRYLNKPDWKDAPKWAQSVACDEDGVWFWHEAKDPEQSEDGWNSDGDVLVAKDSGHDHVEKWRETLEVRPWNYLTM